MISLELAKAGSRNSPHNLEDVHQKYDMGMKQWIRKVRRRRPRSLSDAGGSGEGLEAESTIDLKAKGEQQVLRLPHVQVLFSSTRTSTDDGEISKAQISLQSSVEELESVLQAQLGQSTDELQNSIAACIAQGNDPRHGEPFKNILVSVQGDRAARVQAASSRAGAVMQKMYPLTKLALGLAGTITSSIGYAPVQIVTNGLTQVFEVRTADLAGIHLFQIMLTSLCTCTARHERPETVRRSHGWTRQHGCRRLPTR